MDWFDLLAVHGTLKSLLQHHSSKASILLRSAFFIVQHSHLYMTTGKTIALTRQTFVGKEMSLLFNMPSRLIRYATCILLHNGAQNPRIIFEPAAELERRLWKQADRSAVMWLHTAAHGLSSHCSPWVLLF